MTSRDDYHYFAVTTVENGKRFRNGGMEDIFQKIKLLFWKNKMLQRRKLKTTLLEIASPVIFSSLLVLLRCLVDIEQMPSIIYKPFCTFPMNVSFCNDSSNSNSRYMMFNTKQVINTEAGLVYSPRNTVIDRAMNIYSSVTNVIGYNNSEELINHFTTNQSDFTLAGIQFEDNLLGKDSIPKDLTIKLRFPSELKFSTELTGVPNWKTFLLYPLFQTPGPRQPENNTGAEPFYYKEGFLGLQQSLTYFLILSLQNKLDNTTSLSPALFAGLPLIQMQRFPYHSYTKDPLLPALEVFVGIFILLSFTYPCMNTVKMIVYEKEKQLTESMKIMGMPNWAHWTNWFVDKLLLLLLSVVLIILMLTIEWNADHSVFTKSSHAVLFVFMMIYVCATITFCFAISVFFSKANTASSLASAIFFLSYVPYMFLRPKYEILALSTKIYTSFALNTAMCFGFQLVIMFEEKGEGIQWSNINKTVTQDDNLTLLMIMIMLLVDSVIYLLIALYYEAIYPGAYGVKKPWYFLCTSSYWRGDYRITDFEDSPDLSDESNEQFFESEPTNINAGIQIKKLRKVFDTNIAVNNLTLNMYEGQITVLLGHNGAGKTTTMSMLTGMISPTSGTAVIGGYDITTSMKGVRKSLGLCPQHDILYDELTVTEHLYFFSRLKGIKESEIKDEIEKYLDLLDLKLKAQAQSKTLSGGMKRKLCVGIAFCGNSKVVMLDEPTAGVDPSARRSLWDLIQKQKEGRTILLTTHFMDEADLLGDRIAIMAKGELQCCGSSFFLKKKYGTGYRLIIDKDKSCVPSSVTKLLTEFIQNIQVESNAGSKLTYLMAEKDSAKFPSMLENLEERKVSLGIKSYGISLSTLEEVFLKVGADDKDPRHSRSFLVNNRPSTGLLAITNREIRLRKGWLLLINQTLAMLMKRTLSIVRSWIVYGVAIFLPILFLVLSILRSRSTKSSMLLPPLAFSLDRYEHPVTLVEVPVQNNFSDIYVSLIKNQNHRIDIVTNITKKMLQLSKQIPVTVRMRYIIGATFEETAVNVMDILNITIPVIKAWFNNDPYHSPGLALGLTMNTVYKQQLGHDYNIKFENYPLPFKADSQIRRMLGHQGSGFQIAFNIGFAMSFVTSTFLLFYVKERATNSKHLQFVSGTNAFIFWIVSYICDILFSLIIIIMMLLTLLALQEDGFKSFDDLTRMAVILLYFFASALPLVYLMSFLFEIPSTGFIRAAFIAMVLGCTAFLVHTMFQEPSLGLKKVSDTLNWVFLPVPHYSLCTGILNSYFTYAKFRTCNEVALQCVKRAGLSKKECWSRMCAAYPEYCCDPNTDYYKWDLPGIGRNIIFAVVTGTLLFMILFIIEYRFLHRIFSALNHIFLRRPQPEDDPDEDIDVKNEKTTIRNMSENELYNNYTLVIRDLTKWYGKHLAVDNLCLGVNTSECFGLLGINGAGKTTTFKILTGDIRMSHGQAWVDGYDITNNMKQVQKQIGYCPQFDAVLDNLTAKETLVMYCLIKGVALKESSALANKLAADFDFKKHLHKEVRKLSGGNKRKLSTAISLIGNPKVVYLDEPTTGMDPATKRLLWNKLTEVFASGKCMVLTSHSMEECEALCTRVAVMVNGKFKCLGSIQHLKNKFSQGVTLMIKVQKLQESAPNEHADTMPIEDYVKANFPKSRLMEKHQEMMTFFIEDQKSWPQMFRIIEQAKVDLGIEDYSLTQTSLEQVFLSFTKHQIEEET